MITNPVFNLALLKVDESLCSKYKDIANGNDKILIPFKVFNAHQQTITDSQTQSFQIHELATNVKRIWSVIIDQHQQITTDSINLPFHGSLKDSTTKVVSYNYRTGNSWIYSEPVEELDNKNNNVSLNHIKSAIFSQNKPMMISKITSTGTNAGITSNFEDDGKKMFCMVCPFDYSNESLKNVIQGASSSVPYEFHVKFESSPTNKMCINYCEVGYNLEIQGGNIKYVEKKGGTNRVY